MKWKLGSQKWFAMEPMKHKLNKQQMKDELNIDQHTHYGHVHGTRERESEWRFTLHGTCERKHGHCDRMNKQV